MVRVRIVALVAIALMLAACSAAKAVPPTTEIYGIPIPTIRVHHLVPIASTTQPVPVVDVSATPSGWVPVAYGDAQVSVPPWFSVGYPGCGRLSASGALFIGPARTSCTQYFKRSATVVYLMPIRRVPSAYAGGRATTLNSVRVYGGAVVYSYPSTALDYFVPSLGVQVTADGPLARRVVDTLTRSPRDVVLANGPAAKRPASWHSETVAGLRFSVPTNWPVERRTGSSTGFVCYSPEVPPRRYLALETELTSFFPACPETGQLPRPTSDGIRFDIGPPVPSRFTTTDCRDVHGLTACPATSPAYSILVLRVTVPGRAKPVFVSIGLTGSGMFARTILYSLRPA